MSHLCKTPTALSHLLLCLSGDICSLSGSVASFAVSIRPLLPPAWPRTSIFTLHFTPVHTEQAATQWVEMCASNYLSGGSFILTLPLCANGLLAVTVPSFCICFNCAPVTPLPRTLLLFCTQSDASHSLTTWPFVFKLSCKISCLGCTSHLFPFQPWTKATDNSLLFSFHCQCAFWCESDFPGIFLQEV